MSLPSGKRIFISVAGLSDETKAVLAQDLEKAFPGYVDRVAKNWFVDGQSKKAIEEVLQKTEHFHTPMNRLIEGGNMEAVQKELRGIIESAARRKFNVTTQYEQMNLVTSELHNHLNNLNKNFTFADVEHAIDTYSGGSTTAHFDTHLANKAPIVFSAASDATATKALVSVSEAASATAKVLPVEAPPAAPGAATSSAPITEQLLNGKPVAEYSKTELASLKEKIRELTLAKYVDIANPEGAIVENLRINANLQADGIFEQITNKKMLKVGGYTFEDIAKGLKGLAPNNYAEFSERFTKQMGWEKTAPKSLWQRGKDFFSEKYPTLTAEQQTAQAAHNNPGMSNPSRGVVNPQGEPLIGRVATAAEHAEPSFLGRLGSGIVGHGGTALSTLKTKAKAIPRFGNNLVLAGVAGTGLLTLGAVLSAPKLPVARIPKFDDEDPLAFSGGGKSNVELGGIAMPSIGQQQAASNWISRVPSLGEQLAQSSANGLPRER